MTTYVIRNGELIEKQFAPPLIETHSDGPMVISDTMDATRHMCDGKLYTSKAEFRRVTRAHGCIEVGNETKQVTERKKIPLDREKRRLDIKNTIDMLRAKRS